MLPPQENQFRKAGSGKPDVERIIARQQISFHTETEWGQGNRVRPKNENPSFLRKQEPLPLTPLDSCFRRNDG